MKNTFGLAASVILGISVLIGSAEAKSKSNPVIEANIPFSFHLGSRTLPAGNYKFELATGVPNSEDTVSVVIVRNRDARIYQALAVSVKPGAGLSGESRAVFDASDQHQLVAIWHQGNRLDLQPHVVAAAENADDWSGNEQLVSVVSRATGQ